GAAGRARRGRPMADPPAERAPTTHARRVEAVAVRRGTAAARARAPRGSAVDRLRDAGAAGRSRAQHRGVAPAPAGHVPAGVQPSMGESVDLHPAAYRLAAAG